MVSFLLSLLVGKAKTLSIMNLLKDMLWIIQNKIHLKLIIIIKTEFKSFQVDLHDLENIIAL